jgi:hypothetical protein
MSSEKAAFSRPRNPARPVTELRVDGVPKELIDMLDAVSFARGDRSRAVLVIELLQQWSDRKAHEWSLIQSIVHSNRNVAEAAGEQAQ